MKLVAQKTTGMLKVDVVTIVTTYISAMKNMMNTFFSNMTLEGSSPLK